MIPRGVPSIKIARARWRQSRESAPSWHNFFWKYSWQPKFGGKDPRQGADYGVKAYYWGFWTGWNVWREWNGSDWAKST